MTFAGFLICVFFYAACQLWCQESEYWEGSSFYKELEVLVSMPEQKMMPDASQALQISATRSLASEEKITTPAPSGVEEPVYAYPDIIWPQIDFATLKQINPDIVGWLYCDGTRLNYPIVQGQDNEQYLSQMYDGSQNETGCPFLDAENAADFSDRHSIIYAHNRKDGSMFGELVLFKKQDYYQVHPQILLITETARYVVEIFSGHVARSDSGAWKIEFADTDEYAAWQDVHCARSSIVTGIIPQPQERILTLSTCSYEFSEARYVLHGVLHKAAGSLVEK